MRGSVLITRPQPAASEIAAELKERGIDAVVEPLLRIVPRSTALDLANVEALLFTSSNGVSAFVSQSTARSLPVLTVGDATAAAAREAGFATVHSAAGAVGDLATLVRTTVKPGATLLHGAGADLAGDLAADLPGYFIRRVTLYDAVAATSLSDAARRALRAGEIQAVLLYSPRTARTFSALAAAAGIDTGGLIALAMSGNVAAVLAPNRWRGVKTAAAPTGAAMLALLDEWNAP